MSDVTPSEAVSAEPPAEQPGVRRRGVWEHIAPRVFLLILAVAALLRFYHIGRPSLSLEESLALAASSGRYPDTSPLVREQVLSSSPHFTSMESARPVNVEWGWQKRQESGSPLYVYLLRGWRSAIFRIAPTVSPDAAARALSAALSTLAVLLLFDAAWRLFGVTAAVWAAALMTVAVPQVRAAQDVGPSALLLLLAVMALGAVGRIASAPRTACGRRRVWVAAAVLLLSLAGVALALWPGGSGVALSRQLYSLPVRAFVGREGIGAWGVLLIGVALFLLIPALFFSFARPRRAGVALHVAGHVVCATLVVLCALPLRAYYDPARTVKQDWRGLGETLLAHARDSDPFVFAASDAAHAEKMAVALSHYAHSPERPVLVIGGPATDVQAYDLRHGNVCFLIFALKPGEATGDTELEARARHFMPLADPVKGLSGELHAWRFPFAAVVRVLIKPGTRSTDPGIVMIPQRIVRSPICRRPYAGLIG